MANNEISKNFKIVFTDEAFDAQVERSGMRGSQKFTKRVVEMNKVAEALDRYDTFASLSLKPSDYAKTTGEYGIPAKKFHTGADRLLPHQSLATKAFLKELRGFGLLADVVGSGKTYEACAVLSELSAKGKINSMLLIVPSQVYNTWKEVLEVNFGLGKGVLRTLTSSFDDDCFYCDDDGMIKPKFPIIVKTEDFVKWKEHDVNGVLFDVVVVDEAHNLCVEEGASAKALKLLSILMATKKKAKKTYCVLLSATPHSGNLAQMFRLWYFIRCKGGNAEDFDEKDDSERTEAYQKEKAYYKAFICRGADTVMEFVNNVKLSEATEVYGDEFKAYLTKNKIKNFNKMLEGEKKKVVDGFMKDNKQVATKIKNDIAKAYHNGVLRSIMIRQPNDRIRKGKRIENVFFFPTNFSGSTLNIKGLKNENITVNVNNLWGENAITTAKTSYKLEEYVNENKGNESYRQAFASLFFDNGILQAYGLNDSNFVKSNSIRFYYDHLGAGKQTIKASSSVSDNDVGVSFRAVNGSVFNDKMKELKAVLNKHADGRVIVFFDYDIEKSLICYDKVLKELYADSRFASRVIVGDKTDKSVIEKEFNAKSDAILVVTDNAFTEGANLQKSNVIVNFQVTPNPLAMEQRIGRIFRLGQENDVTIYSFADMTDLEGYVLAYFTYIGLMTSNSGDAAIIAGSNNDNMVTIRCRACQNVKLMSREDYESYLKNDSDEIYCNDNDKCRQDSKRGILMEEINSNEFKCDACGKLIKRQKADDGSDQYMCISTNNTGRGVLCNSGERDDRRYYCRKICVLSHCNRFTSGTLKGRCEALNEYNKNHNISDGKLKEICLNCKVAECRDRCKLISTGIDALCGCLTCGESSCRPKPHVIEFNDKWEAECPSCGDGTLKPIVARTFETYVRSAFAYQQDGGKSFCDNLTKESAKISLIQEILSNDGEN